MTWRAQGFRAWLVQRLSAVYMALFFVYIALTFWLAPVESYFAWRAWVGNAFNAMGLALFFIALLLHAWVGARDIIIDYVHSFPLRFTALIVVGIILFGSGFWLLRILVWMTA